MSYSIGKTAPNKGELEIVIRDELSKVPEAQPVHLVDIDQAFNAAKSLIDLMTDDPARDLYCSVSGSIWKTDAGIQNVSVNVSVNLVDRKS
jgi:hypothetical protein